MNYCAVNCLIMVTHRARAKQIALNCLNDFESYINNDLLLDLADHLCLY